MGVYQIDITTTAGGAASPNAALGPDTDASTSQGTRVSGHLVAVAVDVGTLASTTDITISGEKAGTVLTLTNVAADAVYRPRLPVHDNTGTAISGAYSAPTLFDELVTVTVAQGGNAKAGTVYLIVDPL